MNKLIILVGDTGSGKSHLVNLVSDNYRDDFDVIKKYTNRQKRAGEENAIEDVQKKNYKVLNTLILENVIKFMYFLNHKLILHCK